MSAQQNALPTDGANVIFVAGMSGAGKGTAIRRMRNRFGDRTWFSVSVTTRAPRNGEVDGVDYYFRTKEQFERMIRHGMFLEYACVHGLYYGTPLPPIRDAARSGKMIILDIDVQGVAEAQKKLPKACSFFLYNEEDELRRRLTDRGEQPDSIDKRMANAPGELALARSLMPPQNLIKTVTTFDAGGRQTDAGIDEVVALLMKRIEEHAAQHWA